MEKLTKDTTPKASQVSVGKCNNCRTIFSWKKKKGLMLDDVTCPTCGGGLDLTQFKQKSLPMYSLDGYWPEHLPMKGGPRELVVPTRYEYLVTYQYKFNSAGDLRECKYGVYGKSLDAVTARRKNYKDLLVIEVPKGTLAKLKATDGLGTYSE